MKRIGCILLVLALYAREGSAEPTQAQQDIWRQVEQKMSALHDISYTMVKRERLRPDAPLSPTETFFVKFRKPCDLYMDVLGGPNKGRRILYRAGWAAMKVHVFSRLLQWVVPAIPPISERALEGNHHPVTEAGFDATIRIINENIARNERLRAADPKHPPIELDAMKEVDDDGVPSYYFRSVLPDIFQSYTVTAADHTIFDIARKVDNQAYTIEYYNTDKVTRFDRLTPGDRLRVPVYYGRVSEIWVDRKTLLISHIRITDFNGKTYEEYTNRDMKPGAAAGLTDADFDPKNPDYGF